MVFVRKNQRNPLITHFRGIGVVDMGLIIVSTTPKDELFYSTFSGSFLNLVLFLENVPITAI